MQQGNKLWQLLTATSLSVTVSHSEITDREIRQDFLFCYCGDFLCFCVVLGGGFGGACGRGGGGGGNCEVQENPLFCVL